MFCIDFLLFVCIFLVKSKTRMLNKHRSTLSKKQAFTFKIPQTDG